MEKIDYSKVKEMVVMVGNRGHRAEFLQLGAEGELAIRIIGRNHQYIAQIGIPCRVFINLNGEKFFFKGKITSHSIEKALLFPPNDIRKDQRNTIRYDITPLPARIKERKLMRSNVIEGNVTNISKTGIRIATEKPLESNTDKNFLFETSFRINPENPAFPFSSYCHIHYCIKESGIYNAGVSFEEFSMPNENRKMLEKFLLKYYINPK